MQPPTYDKWILTLHSPPHHKVAGPSGISKEIMSYLESCLQHLLWQLICIYFMLGKIPNE
jgi:hypothetical protein